PPAGSGLPNAGNGPTCITMGQGAYSGYGPDTPLTLTVVLPAGTIDGTAAGTPAGTTASFSVPTGAPYATTTCPTLPATTERDDFTDMIGSAYWENKIRWANKFRSVLALRGDQEKFVVTSLAYSASVTAANCGSATKFLPSPKASLIFGPWANTEFYLQ